MQIEYEELISALSQLYDNVKSGPDIIPLYFLKRCIPSLVQPILLRFNKSLASGIFPSKWKSSFFPIFKSGDKNNVENYRPICILSTIAKVFESIVIKRLTDFLLPLQKKPCNRAKINFVSICRRQFSLTYSVMGSNIYGSLTYTV